MEKAPRPPSAFYEHVLLRRLGDLVALDDARTSYSIGLVRVLAWMVRISFPAVVLRNCHNPIGRAPQPSRHLPTPHAPAPSAAI